MLSCAHHILKLDSIGDVQHPSLFGSGRIKGNPVTA
jgi:hypothetical protein